MRALLLTHASDGLAAAVVAAGVEVEHGEEHRLHAGRYDLAIVDGEADRVARLRRAHRELSVVAWLDRASTERAADLLAAGAREVLDGAMGSRELAARLRNAVPGRNGTGDAVAVAGLHVDLDSGEATWDGRPIGLTRREREVLHVLVSEVGRTVRREALYRAVWGYAMARGDRTVDVNVKRLRDKLARAGANVAIRTEPAVGYRLELGVVTAS